MYVIAGVIWKGDTLIDGVAAVLDKLRAAGKKRFFVTNNSTKSRKGYKKKFDELGLKVAPEEILSCTDGASFQQVERATTGGGLPVLGTMMSRLSNTQYETTTKKHVSLAQTIAATAEHRTATRTGMKIVIYQNGKKLLNFSRARLLYVTVDEEMDNFFCSWIVIMSKWDGLLKRTKNSSPIPAL